MISLRLIQVHHIKRDNLKNSKVNIILICSAYKLLLEAAELLT